MSTFSVGGLASGLDTKSIISQLISIDGRPKLQMEWKSQLNAARKQSWLDLGTRLKALQTSSATLMRADTWDAAAKFGATSANAAVVSASVTGTPATGTYAVDVTRLARGEVDLSSATFGGVGATGDTLSIDVGGTVTSVALAAGDQVQDIINKINATAGVGVVASLDGTSIRLESTSIGAASAFSVSSSGTTAADLAFVETQSAQDAQYTVNGATFLSATNTNVAGAIAGVSLDLRGAGSTTITVAEKAEWVNATKAKIADFVAKYNASLDLVYQKTQNESRVASPKNLGEYLSGPMSRNHEFSKFGTDLRNALSDNVSGLAGNDGFLSSIGITTSFDAGAKAGNGRLVIDDAKLDAALRADPDKVKAVLTQTGAGTGISADDGFARRISELTVNMDIRLDNKDQDLGTQSRNLQRSIDAASERLERRKEYYERMYASLETSLGRLQSQGSWLSGQLAGLSGGRG